MTKKPNFMLDGEDSRKETKMKFKVINGMLALVLVVGFVALTLTPATLSAPLMQDVRAGRLHVTKNCKGYVGDAGQSCTITTSTLAAIPAGSKVFYDQAANTPTGLLDSNVVLDAGNGNRAVGRCTLDFATGLGLCTFSDGTGQLAGFQARLDVSYISGDDWAWDGTYRFSSVR
jgi:hypothetical protein